MVLLKLKPSFLAAYICSDDYSKSDQDVLLSRYSIRILKKLLHLYTVLYKSNKNASLALVIIWLVCGRPVILPVRFNHGKHSQVFPALHNNVVVSSDARLLSHARAPGQSGRGRK